MQIMSGNGEQKSMQVICGSYFVADPEGPLAFLMGWHVYKLSGNLSPLLHKYVEYGMHSCF